MMTGRGPGPLVGRGAEVAALAATVQALDRPATRFLAISGEPGIGKTRLLEELARQGDEGGCLVLTGRGAELERELPFGIWVDALDDHVAELGSDRLERLLGERIGELARVLPSVAASDAPASSALQDERYRAHRAVRALLERLADARPLIILLDDLQWADGSSLELVAHLLRRPPRAPLLIALAYRAGGLPAPVLGAAHAADRDGLLVDLSLAPLSAGDAGALLGDTVAPSIRERLYRLSGGNPFYLHALARDGALAEVPEAFDPIAGVPPQVAASLAQEIGALPEQARLLAQGAAVAGDPAEVELAGIAGDLAEDAALAALDELATAGLLMPTPVSRRYRFRHPIVRRAVYEGAAEGWRLAAHARVAAALEHRGASPAARAHHVERCATPGDEAAIALLTQAGLEAAPRAPAAAAQWFAAALRLLPGGPDDAQRRLGLLVPLATALAATGQLERALATLLEVLELVPAELADLRARLVGGCAACENLLGRHRAAHDRLLRALDELSEETSAAAGSLEAELASDALYDTDFPQVEQWAERARSTAVTLGDGGLQALASALLCFAHYGQGRLESAEAARAAAAAALDELPDDELMARLEAPYNLGFAEFLCERFDEAIEHLRRGIAVSRAAGQGQFVVPMMVGLAHSLEVRGELREALDTAEGAVEAARLAGNPQVTAWALVGEGWVAAMAGDLERAGAASAEAVELLGGLDESVLTVAARALAAVIFLEAGDVTRCLEEAHAAGAPDFPRVEPGRRAWLGSALARAELARGRPEVAEECLARGEQELGEQQLPLTESTLLHARALHALDTGDARRAAELARRAAERADAVGAVVHGSRMRALEGRALADAGDREPALDVLQRAQSELGACGAQRLRDEAVRDLRRLGVRVPGRQRRFAAGEGLEALSGREREIAELVARGMTNRDIASDLFLSEKTVEGHLSNVFKKLGVSSRAAVAEAVGRANAPA